MAGPSYSLGNDGKQVTLVLRDGVTFSDGAPLNADAVIANFDKVKSTGYLTSSPAGVYGSWTRMRRRPTTR